jgi:uncharacterized membrane protein YjjP (DUF1212 family)
MDYNTLLELAVELGYSLAIAGAETFRVEESVTRVLDAYGIQAECFAIPNNLIVSIETPEGKPMTRMRRIGQHGNDLDAVEKFSGLSRAICSRKPEPKEAMDWLHHVENIRLSYSPLMCYLGDFMGASGFALFFGGTWYDCICAGLCGIAVGFITKLLDKLKANQFFSTIAASFVLAMLAYTMGQLGIAHNPHAVTIGTLMLLVPGLLFTNAMRDIIYGDTNSGVNRLTQVLLVAVALALGTAVAWNTVAFLWGPPVGLGVVDYSFFMICIAMFVACQGFAILFNIHGPGSMLCSLGGVLCWAVYDITMRLGCSEILAYFWGAVFASAYAEVMARVRKYPAISYLVVAIFPLIPGAGVYYAMNYAVQGNMERFASQGMYTAAIAGVMAVGILLVSTTVRLHTNWKLQKK